MQVALIYGGRSTEHDVSVASAAHIHTAILDGGHTVTLIAITLDGRWYLQEESVAAKIATDREVTLRPGVGAFVDGQKLPIDVAIAPTHGWGGEDGNLQGLCTLCAIPLVGCDTLSSGVGMYKMVAQELFAAHAIPTVETVLVGEDAAVDRHLFDRAVERLGPALFIKPESSGSSVGVSALRTADLAAFCEAIRIGRKHSERVLVQTLVTPLIEAECAILEREDGTVVAAGPGRVIDPGAEAVGFLDYHHKYTASGGATMQVPSGLGAEIDEQIRSLATQAFRAIKGNGYARVDFFVSDGKVFLNEINTAPGMTAQSHWPALMKSAGWPLTAALNELFASALRRRERNDGRIYTPPVLT
ncbi:MAG TPA: D-alanine--D-alanine ligase [Sphaerochaeta sp.]|jgi:D-alanine-D-alanine ligase|nr:D-alanine--D-alanine ligase [Spirochaetota bacterium]NLV60674.1 D-alanine--D-alanine ligase [Spirochaetales bacterium]HOE84079.1 D-alanine--D-alanine ligase [Sphaerochaeta sp.]HOQ94375.1 D-alanine--D-alanine ligase [Sphaerochaeta sp.]HPK46860.1 D-alanine--D-alanine ligase [Sphaerochaeta sp.]